MAGVKEGTQTAEDKAAAGKNQVQREADFAKKIIGTLDLPAGLAGEIDDAEDGKKGKKGSKGTQEEHEEEGAEEGSEEGEESAEGEEGAEGEEESSSEESSEEGEEGEAEGEEGEDEDLSPKGKKAAQKRINDLIKSNKRKDAEIARLKGAKPADTSAAEEETDADQKTLNRLASQPDGLAKLKNLKRDVQNAWKAETDPKKASALLDLTEKIDATVSSLPQRFQSTQKAQYDEAVKETVEAYGETFTQKVGNEIWGIAKTIFAKSATLQASPSGQAESWRLAVERYEEQKKLTAGKSKTVDLQRQNNHLKKKVSLDVAVAKGNTDKSEGKRLFNKAKNGNASDRTAFVKKAFNTDSLIPEEYRR